MSGNNEETIKTDVATAENAVDNTVKTETTKVTLWFDKIKPWLQRFSDAFHRYALYVIIALAVGAYGGIKGSKVFYNQKLKDCVRIGGMIVEDQVYQIIKK